jgi:hypothetical protein
MKKYLLVIAASVFITLSLALLVRVSNVNADAWGPYKYYNVTSANASSTAGVVIRGGSGVLGKIIIASSSPLVAAGLKVYDGTSTSTGTLIGTFKTSTTEQSIELDVSVIKGIVLDVPVGFNGSFIFATQ